MLASPHHQAREQLQYQASGDVHEEPPQAAHHGLATHSQTFPLGQPVVPSSILSSYSPSLALLLRLAPSPPWDGHCAPSSPAKALPPSPRQVFPFLPSTAPASRKCVHSHKSLATRAGPAPRLAPHHPTQGPHGLNPPLSPSFPHKPVHAPSLHSHCLCQCILPGLPGYLLAFYRPNEMASTGLNGQHSPAPQHPSAAPLLTGTHMGAPKPTQPEGYFHSTMLMHAFRSGFCRVKQNRALAGRGAAGGTGFLDFSFCCLFFMSSWGEAGSMVFLPQPFLPLLPHG